MLQLHIDESPLCIIKLKSDDEIPDIVRESDFLSITRTKEELSIVCDQVVCPDTDHVEPGYCLIRIVGPLDFNMTGVLSKLLLPLAETKISVFTISTYNTDYILVKTDQIARAREVLSLLPDIQIVN